MSNAGPDADSFPKSLKSTATIQMSISLITARCIKDGRAEHGRRAIEGEGNQRSGVSSRELRSLRSSGDSSSEPKAPRNNPAHRLSRQDHRANLSGLAALQELPGILRHLYRHESPETAGPYSDKRGYPHDSAPLCGLR